ncbi:DUF2071 domain-containing protein [soil metagenome]|jgi:uncharacterized protein YqjF (DUF2071 family)
MSTAEKVLGRTDHRPYPLPEGPWALAMSWHDLLFMHWPVPAEVLRPLIPPSLELDTFDGNAWLGVVPFRMSGVRPHFLPGVSPLSNFPELNLRTYVSNEGKPGIWFFSLDAHNPVAVRIARATFNLPYYDAKMFCHSSKEEVTYASVRTHKTAPTARFVGRYRPIGEVSETRSDTLENFLTERYCLYSSNARGIVWRGDIHHHMWPLQRAEVEVATLEMTGQIGVELPDKEPLLHYARRLDVVAWLPRRIDL